MIDSFYTIEKEGEGLYEEKLSKFISYAYSVENKCQVQEIMENIHKMHRFARHIVYSYIIIDNNTVLKKYSDDGEPQKTAGFPLMTLLTKKKLTNVLLVVVRYFGGILLGAGPLARAYLASGINCLDNCNIITRNIANIVAINVEYKDVDKVINMVKNIEGIIDKIEYQEKVLIYAKIPKQDILKITNSISNYDSKTDFIVKGGCYI